MTKKPQFKYGKPMDAKKVASHRKRLPYYDDCLREFLNSGSGAWIVDINALPSKDPRVVLSSLKWRIKHFSEYEGIRAFMSKGKIYLERVDGDA
jgi:hypothetical protein